MSQLVDPKAQDIENTFMPNCINKYLSVNGIITSLQRGFCKYEKLPKEVQEKVDIVLDQRTKN